MRVQKLPGRLFSAINTTAPMILRQSLSNDILLTGAEAAAAAGNQRQAVRSLSTIVHPRRPLWPNPQTATKSRPDRVINSSHNAQNSTCFIPCFNVIRIYKKKPYLTNANAVADGFMRQSMNDSVPRDLMVLFRAYAFDIDAGLFQIAYHIHAALKKLKQRGITMRVVKLLIQQYLRVTESKAAFYGDELVRFQYLEAVKDENNSALHALLGVGGSGTASVYRIGMDSILKFNALKSKYRK